MKAAVILDGDPPTGRAADEVRRCATIVCADGAVRWCQAEKLAPYAVVGDMDSASDEELAWAAGVGARIERHPVDKDETDGRLAFDAALAAGASTVVVAGAIGGRTALTLANLKLLRRALREGLEACLVHGEEEIRLVGAGVKDTALLPSGASVSVLPVGEAATVTLTGTRWAGTFRLDADSDRGVSNVADEDGWVRIDEGVSLVVIEHGAAHAASAG